MGELIESDESKANPTEEAPQQAPPWAPTPLQLHRYKSREALADAVAKRFLDSAKRAIEKYDHFNVVLAGGEVARDVYLRLNEEPYRDEVPWKRTFFVFSDEICVQPDDERSHYRLARETLFDPLEIDEHHVLRMKGEDKPADAARRYEVRLGDLFLIRPKRSFDFTLLEVGAEGGMASLLPGTDAVEESDRWVAANHVAALDEWRLTLTLPALNASARVVLLAGGSQVAQTVAEAFGGVNHDTPYPCERIASGVRREALVDQEAASMLTGHDDA